MSRPLRYRSRPTVETGRSLNNSSGSSYIDVCDKHGEREPCRNCRTRRASAIVSEPVRMLTREIPRATTTVLTGVPGVGKSTTNIDLAARVSRQGEPVLILTAEDHLAAVIRPRLEAADADLDLVHVLVVDMTFPDDLYDLREIIEELRPALVMIDPLVAFISESVNSHRDHHVRRVLAPLGAIAEETGAAIVVVIHANKGASGDPLMRVSGSVGFTGAARTVVVAAEDPKDGTRFIYAVAKSNLVKKPTPIAYRLVGVDLGGGITTSKVEWLGEAPEIDVRELLSTDRGERQGDRARAFLREAGVLSEAQPAARLEADAEALGINYRTLRRAADELAVPKWKSGMEGGWWWGPKPSGGEGDSGSGHSTVVPMSPSVLPAQMPSERPEGDNDRTVGDDVPACVRCGRYAVDHVGGHIARWEDAWKVLVVDA